MGGCERNGIYKKGNQQEAPTLGKETQNPQRSKHHQLTTLARSDHDGVIQEFKMTNTGTFRNDAMLEKITEAVQIDNVEPARLENTMAEIFGKFTPQKTLLYLIVLKQL